MLLSAQWVIFEPFFLYAHDKCSVPFAEWEFPQIPRLFWELSGSALGNSWLCRSMSGYPDGICETHRSGDHPLG